MKIVGKLFERQDLVAQRLQEHAASLDPLQVLRADQQPTERASCLGIIILEPLNHAIHADRVAAIEAAIETVCVVPQPT